MSTAQENKVKFGLKNVHYALLKEEGGKIIYDTPVPVPGAVSMTLDPRGEMTEFFADNILYYSASNNQGYDGTLTMAEIPESYAVDCLGEVKDETDGVITEIADRVGKPHALLFQFEGDVKATRHVLYNCNASRPTVEGETTTDTKEPKTSELKFVAGPRSTDLRVKTKTTVSTPNKIYNNWYKKVYEKITNTVSPNAATYDKKEGVKADIVLTIASDAGATVTALKLGDVNIPDNSTNNWAYADNTLTIKQAYLDTLEDNDYTLNIEMSEGVDLSVTLKVQTTA